MLVPAGGTWNDTATDLRDVMRTRTAVETEGLLIPVEGRDGKEARHSGEAMRTMTTRNETALLVPYYGNGTSTTTDQAIGTLTTKDRWAFVVPLRAHNTPKSTTEPFDTIAANGNHHAMVTRHNSSTGDGSEMSTPVTEYLRTLTTAGHQSVTTWEHPQVDDCLFRMLEPHEIAAGMAFQPGYQILGNKREKVRQAGNAVCPPNARDLVSCVAESLGGAA
jgi:DNA (cytosine-5)-methyltransferase 1